MTDQPLKTLCSKCGKDADGGSTGGVPICWDCYYNNLNKKHNKLWCAACGTWGDHQSGTCPTITHNSSLKTQNHPHMPYPIIADNSKVNRKFYATFHQDKYCHEYEDENVWTVSTDPNTTGWETDSNTSGYGLSKSVAQHLAHCANEHPELHYQVERLKKENEAMKKVVEVAREVFKFRGEYKSDIDKLDNALDALDELENIKTK